MKVNYCSQECQKQDWAVHRQFCYPVSAQSVGAAGRGWVATRKIKMGELILRETACLSLSEDIEIWEAGDKIYRQVEKLSKSQQEEFYKLTRKKGLLEVSENLIEAAGTDNKKLEMAKSVAKTIEETAIFFNNDIKTEDNCKCLFLKLALTNHSCAPNSSWTGGSKNPRQLELRAAKDICVDEEVTVNYIIVESRFSNKTARQRRLLDGWGFSCCCRLCDSKKENLDVQAREDELKCKIVKAQKEMTKECDRNPALVNWRTLCSLQREILESVSQLHSAQLLLFREYNSLVHLSQLSRNESLLLQTLKDWEELLKKLNVERAWKDFNICKDKLKEYKPMLKTKNPPTDQEIMQFLWLM